MQKKSNDTDGKTQVFHNMDGLAGLLAQMQDKTGQTEKRKSNKEAQRSLYNEFSNPTYHIISTFAFLIGVEKRHFENPVEPPQLLLYEQLSKSIECRIMRNLCMLRNAFEMNFAGITRSFQYDVKNIGSLPDLIPADSVNELSKDGIQIYKSKPDAISYIIAINNEINNRVNSISAFFPEWVNWKYIKPLFIMTSGTKEDGVKEAGAIYNSDRGRYPYQCWLNWSAVSFGESNQGNILYNDEKFLKLLYERNEDRFENLSLVRDAGNQTMRNFSAMLEKSKKCVIVVDCENSDAVKLAAALSGMTKGQLEKIYKVILFDSEYTTPQWSKMVDHSLYLADKGADRELCIEHILVARVNQNKSQVDMTLAVRTSKEVYMNNADAVILASSDSDYWAMIKQLENVHFLVMLEREKTGIAIMDTLAIHDIPYCFIDDFCTGASYSIKTATLIDEIQGEIDRFLRGETHKPFNVKEIMNHALKNSWIVMTEREQDSFYSRYLLRMKLIVTNDGKVEITIES